MITKEKFINLKNIKKIIIVSTLLFILIFLIIGIKYYDNLRTQDVMSSDVLDDTKISNANKIDVEQYINSNNKKQNEETDVEEIELEYITRYKNNPDLPKNIVQVVQEGRTGLQKITTKRVYDINGNLIEEKRLYSVVTKASIDRIVEVGTANYTSNYTVKIKDNIYVTTDRLSVLTDNSIDADKIATLSKDTKMTVKEIEGDWYKIITDTGISGWVKSDSTTYIAPNSTYNDNNDSEKNKTVLIAKLDFNMDLNQKSGLSLNQFKKILSDSKDTNKVFSNNAEYFYFIEKQYNINGVFVAAVGIHESAWATSKISMNKHNLFGYGAYDSNPYNGAYSFSNYSESIDLVSRVFKKYYLNPNGIEIYAGEYATGQYYSGNTLSSINKRYATDKQWANKVYSYMKYLYDKI